LSASTVDDVRVSARKGILRIYGTAVTGWLDERPGWRGQRLSAKGAHDVITGLAAAAGLDDDATTQSTSARRADRPPV